MPPERESEPRSPEHACLGEAVRLARDEAGLTQEELADRIGTDTTQVGGIERGVRNPSYETLLRFAVALETSVGALAGAADRLRAEGFGSG